MNMPPNHGDFNKGLDLFNHAHLFGAHEVLEDVWRSLRFAGRADSSTIAYSTDTAATAEVSTEVYRQRHVC